jgi:hypothetical protein
LNTPAPPPFHSPVKRGAFSRQSSRSSRLPLTLRSKLTSRRSGWHTAMKQLRIVTLRFGRQNRKWPLNDRQIPNVRVVRVHASTGYNRAEGNRRASRNGRVSDLPPEIPNVTIRNFSIAVHRAGSLRGRHTGCMRRCLSGAWSRICRASFGGATSASCARRPVFCNTPSRSWAKTRCTSRIAPLKMDGSNLIFALPPRCVPLAQPAWVG